MPARRASRLPIYVVQKHDASRLHYDFRLEVDGVLKSWAIPKGPSMNPRDKRLAVPVEDHPLDYAGYEGVIAAGYGAGTVLVWDRGVYRNLTEIEGEAVPMPRALAAGRAVIRLEGSKLRGAFALTRMSGRAAPNWLLVKIHDADAEYEGDILNDRPESVLTGRTIEEIGGDLTSAPNAR